MMKDNIRKNQSDMFSLFFIFNADKKTHNQSNKRMRYTHRLFHRSPGASRRENEAVEP
jgi:hypothetical protein